MIFILYRDYFKEALNPDKRDILRLPKQLSKKENVLNRLPIAICELPMPPSNHSETITA